MNILLNLFAQWYRHLKSRQINNRENNIWVFGEWFGERCGDNSAYFANYIAENIPGIQLYWIAKEGCNTDMLNPSIKKIYMDTVESKNLLDIAGVIIVNQNLLDISSTGYNYYSTAITINLWHGIMWKKIGHDGDKRKGHCIFKLYCSVLDPIQSCTYYIAPSELYVEHFHTAFGTSKQHAIRCGYPRNSLLYDDALVKQCNDEIKTKINASRNSIIIAYMPTFRDRGDSIADLREIKDQRFFDYLLENDIYIIQKSHFVNQKKGCTDASGNTNRIICLNSINATRLLAASDLLITDYSSCFFDYLIMDRPIIHYLYDYDNYRTKDRGLYYEQSEVVCGDVVYNTDELFEAIKSNLSDTNKGKARRAKMKELYATYESKDSCETLFNEIKHIQGDKPQ